VSAVGIVGWWWGGGEGGGLVALCRVGRLKRPVGRLFARRRCNRACAACDCLMC